MSRIKNSEKDLSRVERSSKSKKKTKGKSDGLWSMLKSIFLETKPYLLLVFLYLLIRARIHQDNEKDPVRRLIWGFLSLFVKFFTKVFHDEGIGMLLGGAVGLAVSVNLFHLILGWENFKENWGYFFSREIRKKVKKKAKGDALYISFTRINAFGLILVTIVFPLYVIILIVVLR